METTLDKRKFVPIVSTIAFAAFMVSLDSYIVNVSLPSIATFFNVSMSRVTLVILAYMVSLTSTTLIFGKLTDRFGLKAIFLLGYVVFSIGSLLCGISAHLPMLVASRFLQGIGGSMLIIAAYAIIPRQVPHEIRGWAFARVSVVAAFGVTVGAPLGGLITGYLSWHWVFLINIPIGIAAVIVGRRILPADRPRETEEARPPFDILGALLSFLGIFAIVYALNNGSEEGWASPKIVAGLVVFAVSLLSFLVWEKRAPDPLLALRLFRNARFDLMLIAGGLAFMVVAGNNLLLPFYLEIDRGLAPQRTGIVLMLYSIAIMIVGPKAGAASDRIKPAVLCTIAMGSAGTAFLFFALLLPHQSPWPAVIFLVWLGVSCGLFLSPNSNQVMSEAPAEDQGAASGLFNMVMRLSLVLGACILETVFSEVVPHGAGSLAASDTSSQTLNHGFALAYTLAAALCFVAMAVSLITATRAPGREATATAKDGSNLPAG
ncbi:MAG: DHA2 family efflux MFS transporter permease subunit [Acidobacteriota bacterium]